MYELANWIQLNAPDVVWRWKLTHEQIRLIRSLMSNVRTYTRNPSVIRMPKYVHILAIMRVPVWCGSVTERLEIARMHGEHS